MIAIVLDPAVLHALATTGLAAAVAVPLLLLLVALPQGWAASLAALLVLAPLLPVPDLPPGLGSLPAEVTALLPFVALPPAWGLRRIPTRALRVAASLAGPARRFFRFWLKLATPWLLVGLAWGFARALAAGGLVWPAAILLLAAARPMLRVLAARPE